MNSSKSKLKRRDFLKKSAVAAGSLGLMAAGCKSSDQTTGGSVASGKKYKWKMVTTWPKNFPGLGTGAEYLAKIIGQMSGGRIEVKVYGAGELVPALEIFDAVGRGTAEMGHGAAYYWKGKHEAVQYFGSVPFGLTPAELNGWIYHGGGQELWDEVYAPFGLKPFLAGNTDFQMGGWFNKLINQPEDLKGLKMRIPGLGGEVLRRLGVTVVNLPGGEIFQALQSGTIDATEFVGPYNDLAFGFFKGAKYYYAMGWHEPGTGIECFFNKSAYESLPSDLKQIVTVATQAANTQMLSEIRARNAQALMTLQEKHSVKVKQWPDGVIKKISETSKQVIDEIASRDPVSRKVHDSYFSYLKQMTRYVTTYESYFGHRQKVFGV